MKASSILTTGSLVLSAAASTLRTDADQGNLAVHYPKGSTFYRKNPEAEGGFTELSGPGVEYFDISKGGSVSADCASGWYIEDNHDTRNVLECTVTGDNPVDDQVYHVSLDPSTFAVGIDSSGDVSIDCQRSKRAPAITVSWNPSIMKDNATEPVDKNDEKDEL